MDVAAPVVGWIVVATLVLEPRAAHEGRGAAGDGDAVAGAAALLDAPFGAASESTIISSARCWAPASNAMRDAANSRKIAVLGLGVASSARIAPAIASSTAR